MSMRRGWAWSAVFLAMSGLASADFADSKIRKLFSSDQAVLPKAEDLKLKTTWYCSDHAIDNRSNEPIREVRRFFRRHGHSPIFSAAKQPDFFSNREPLISSNGVSLYESRRDLRGLRGVSQFSDSVSYVKAYHGRLLEESGATFSKDFNIPSISEANYAVSNYRVCLTKDQLIKEFIVKKCQKNGFNKIFSEYESYRSRRSAAVRRRGSSPILGTNGIFPETLRQVFKSFDEWSEKTECPSQR